MHPLRIIFFGTPDFAVPSLQILIDHGYNIVAVVTAPDKPQGRGLKLSPSPVKVYAESKGIPVLQPEKLKDPEFIHSLQTYAADIQVVVAFRMLPVEVWNMPRLGTFNLHASLLPNYRGAAPINWALMNGEKTTGLTTFFLKHEIDTGDIFLQKEIAILDSDNFASLYVRMSQVGAKLVLQTIEAATLGKLNLTPQNYASQCKLAPKLKKEMGKIHWDRPSIEIHNLVRGFPGAYTTINGVYTRVWESTVVTNEHSTQPWVTDQKSYLHVKTKDGFIAIKRLQPEGKRQMEIQEFLAGNIVTQIA